MARGSEVRARMVDAGTALLARRGYGITMLEVVKEAGAPRGSIYYHFPDGKEELAIAAAAKTGSELSHLVQVMARRNPEIADFLCALVDHHTKRLVASGYSEGCPLLGVTVSAGSDSPALRESAASAFEVWVGAIAGVLREKGLEESVADQLASTTIAAIEGSIVLARAARRREPLDRFKGLLPALVAALPRQGAAS